MGVAQDEALQQEFQIDQSAITLLEIEPRGIAAVEFGAHLPPHRRHIDAELRGIAWHSQHLAAQCVKCCEQAGIPHDPSRAHQGLMLPGPGALALILAEAGKAGHQQALGPIRAQPHIDIEQAPRARAHTQQGHDLLTQSCIPARRIQRPCTIRLCVQWCIEQEYQIEIGAEAQLLRTQRAITQHGESSTGNDAMRRTQLRLGQCQHALDHRFCQPGQPTRAILRRHPRIQQRQCEAETQRLPHLVQGIQRCLRITLDSCCQTLRMHAGTIRQLATHAHIQQLVQQQRMRGQPFAQQRAARQRIDQPRNRRRLLIEQGQITGPAQDVVQQRQHAPQHHIRLRGCRRVLQQRWHHSIQSRTRHIRKLAHAGGACEIAQQCMQFVCVGETFRFQLRRLGMVR